MSSPRMLTPGLFGEFSRGSTGPMSKSLQSGTFQLRTESMLREI